MGDGAAAMNGAANKAVVARAVDEVINGGNLDAVHELYAPASPRRRRHGWDRSGRHSRMLK